VNGAAVELNALRVYVTPLGYALDRIHLFLCDLWLTSSVDQAKLPCGFRVHGLPEPGASARCFAHCFADDGKLRLIRLAGRVALDVAEQASWRTGNYRCPYFFTDELKRALPDTPDLQGDAGGCVVGFGRRLAYQRFSTTEIVEVHGKRRRTGELSADWHGFSRI
jgi:hypothetical protein